MNNAKCTTCNAEFDATLRCPECRQPVIDPKIDALARLTAAVVELAPAVLATSILARAKK